jgi:hypothetical protein
LKTSNTAASAQTTYLTAAAHISGAVSDLQTMANRLHDTSPDAIDWGHVGDLTRIQEELSQVLFSLKNRGPKNEQPTNDRR